MSIMFTMLKKDLLRLTRDRTALLLLIVVPVILIALFGQVFGVNKPNSGPNGVPLAVVSVGNSEASAKLLAALNAEPAFQIVTTRRMPDKSQVPLTEEDLRPLMQA